MHRTASSARVSRLFVSYDYDLNKWHPNLLSLQSSNTKSEREFTYAKETFKNTTDLTKILRVLWDKNRENLSIAVSDKN